MLFRLILALLALPLLVAPLSAGSNETPVGLNGLGIFLGDGQYAPGTPHPTIAGCDLVPGFCPGQYFYEEVVGFTPEQVAADQQAARDFMLERFGLDVDALSASGQITWLEMYADPRINYRARVLPDQDIHRYGWTVHDMSYLLIANVPLQLGGEFEGVEIPPGSLLSKGRYVIQKSRLVEFEGREVLVNLPELAMLEFQSASPILSPSDPRTPILGDCEIISSPWGTGLATVPGIQVAVDGGLVKHSIRNYLTFDGAAGYGSYVGVDNDEDLIQVDR